jgi:hypothetical protein
LGTVLKIPNLKIRRGRLVAARRGGRISNPGES